MSILDIVIIVIIILGAAIGFKKGAINRLIQLVGTTAIALIAYHFKDVLGNFLIDKLQFLNLFGELSSVNILFYQGIAFIIIFVLLYCVLNIILNISGILDMIVKVTIIFEIPSKIIGAILGAIEGAMFSFIIIFVMLQGNASAKLVMKSTVSKSIVEHMPVVSEVFKGGVNAAEKIYKIVDGYDGENAFDKNLEIVRTLISNGVTKSDVIQNAIDSKKINLPGVTVGGK